MRSSGFSQPVSRLRWLLVRLDYSAEVVQHADLCPVRASESAEMGKNNLGGDHGCDVTRLVVQAFALHTFRRRRNASLLRAYDFTIYSGQIRAARCRPKASCSETLYFPSDISGRTMLT